jgi:L-glyceraldehyde 3-phosphate reductase
MSRDMLTETTMAQVRALTAIAEPRGQSLAQMALAWALRDPRMTSLVIGASSVTQLDVNLSALENPAFTDDELAAIDLNSSDAGINLWATSSNS